jgi:hypothetical protein
VTSIFALFLLLVKVGVQIEPFQMRQPRPARRRGG